VVSNISSSIFFLLETLISVSTASSRTVVPRAPLAGSFPE
jgi:hypothetical protein